MAYKPSEKKCATDSVMRQFYALQKQKQYYALTKAIYPELDTLNEDTKGALVSMIYNRGDKLDGDRRKEMRAIVNLVAKKDYEGIADQIERSKRLWVSNYVGSSRRVITYLGYWHIY